MPFPVVSYKVDSFGCMLYKIPLRQMFFPPLYSGVMVRQVVPQPYWLLACVNPAINMCNPAKQVLYSGSSNAVFYGIFTSSADTEIFCNAATRNQSMNL